MQYIHTETGEYPVTQDQIKARNPSTLFPEPFEPVDGYALVEFGTVPAFDPATHKAVEAPPLLIDGKWVQAWEVLELTAGEIAQREADTAAALGVAKTAKNAAINAARLAANFGTFTHGGKVFACDQLSRSDIDGTNGYVALNGALPPGWPGGWKAVDNTYAAITTLAQWKAFYGSMFAAGNANFARAQALKTQLASATTLQQIEGIQW